MFILELTQLINSYFNGLFPEMCELEQSYNIPVLDLRVHRLYIVNNFWTLTELSYTPAIIYTVIKLIRFFNSLEVVCILSLLRQLKESWHTSICSSCGWLEGDSVSFEPLLSFENWDCIVFRFTAEQNYTYIVKSQFIWYYIHNILTHCKV